MRNIPDFTCEYGLAALILREVPRIRTAYVLPAWAVPGQEAELLEECRRFCRMAGAERVLALGEPPEGRDPAIRLLRMSVSRSSIPETTAALWPLLPEQREDYCRIFNRAMADIPGAISLTLRDLAAMEGCYFVHREGTLLGLGQVADGELKAIVSCVPGAGMDVAAALLSALWEDTVTLKVAESNRRAIRLYEKLGFVPTGIAETWYEL